MLRGQSNQLHEDWLRGSLPVRMASVLIAHPIRDVSEKYFNLLENFNIGITLAFVYLFSFLGILAVSFLINEATHRIRLGGRRMEMPYGIPIERPKKIFSALNSFSVTRLSAIGLFVLSTQLFLWFSELFLTNNIKVDA